MANSENLARWRAAVTVGGDGTLAEVANGLFDRADWQDALAHLPLAQAPTRDAGAGLAKTAAAGAVRYVQYSRFGWNF